MSIFETGLQKNSANYVPLSPVSFLRRAAQIVPEHTAIIDGKRKYTYSEFWQRSSKLASALNNRGIGSGDCVAILAGNIPEMLEAHNGVPMVGAILNSLNTRLDPQTICFILNHGEAKVLLADCTFSEALQQVVENLEREILIIDISDPDTDYQNTIGEIDYETFICINPAIFSVGSADITAASSLELYFTRLDCVVDVSAVTPPITSTLTVMLYNSAVP